VGARCHAHAFVLSATCDHAVGANSARVLHLPSSTLHGPQHGHRVANPIGNLELLTPKVSGSDRRTKSSTGTLK
jgi:hypothetical protein